MLLSQVYSIVKDRTEVDREIHHLCTQQPVPTLRMVHLCPSVHSETGVVFTADVQASLSDRAWAPLEQQAIGTLGTAFGIHVDVFETVNLRILLILSCSLISLHLTVQTPTWPPSYVWPNIIPVSLAPR